MDRKIASEQGVSAVAFSADGSMLRGLCQDHKLRAWDVSAGTLRQTVDLEKGDTSPVLTGTGLTTVGQDGTVKIWDLAGGKVSARLRPAGLRARRLAVSSDGLLFAANVKASDEASETAVRLLDGAGRERFVVPSGLGGVASLAISPDGTQVVAASYDADVRAWNARNGELLRLIDELPVSMFAMQFSPDGKWLAAAGADRIVYLFDTKTWRIARKLEGQPEMISALAFSPDGRRMITGGFSVYTVKRPVKVIIWNVASGKPERTLDASRQVRSVAFSPDGRTAAVATGEKAIDVWQASA